MEYEFGTHLLVCYAVSGACVEVVVTATGGFDAYGRDIDLSLGAAEAVGLTYVGVGEVSIEEGIQNLDDIRAALPFSVGDIIELANLPVRYFEEDVAPISIKAYSRKRGSMARSKATGSGEVVDLRSAENIKEG